MADIQVRKNSVQDTEVRQIMRYRGLILRRFTRLTWVLGLLTTVLAGLLIFGYCDYRSSSGEINLGWLAVTIAVAILNIVVYLRVRAYSHRLWSYTEYPFNIR